MNCLFPGGSSNFIWGSFGYYSQWLICTLCPWWPCWHLWEPVLCWGWQQGEPWQSGEQGRARFTELLWFTELLVNAQRQGLGSAFPALAAASTSQPSLWATSHLFQLEFLALPSSGSRKVWEFGKYEIWWKKTFRCGRCILMDGGKTHPNNGNYELLKIASSHLFSGMLGSQIPPLSTAPDGFREIIICWCFSPIRASF